MKTWLTNYSRRSRRAGLTLIEVVAAIAILGAVLVGVVLAKSKHTRQVALTQRTDAAVRAADELIAGWWTSGQGLPIGQTGEIDSDPPLTWETRWVKNKDVEQLRARVLRVEIGESIDGRVAPINDGEPLFAVDLVMPEPVRDDTTDTADQADSGRRGMP